ncbi:Glycosyl transferase family 31 [Trinorchestia longiramus]|nr:Glycosyl transferase family 31 [Trinorchestia longiramus]
MFAVSCTQSSRCSFQSCHLPDFAQAPITGLPPFRLSVWNEFWLSKDVSAIDLVDYCIQALHAVVMYRVWCRGARPCVVTVLLVLCANVFYRTLLLLESRGTLARHGLNISLPKIGLSFRKPLKAQVPLQFLVEERSYCARQQGLLAIALVPSTTGDFALRQETRQTWGSAQALGVPLGTVFLLGRHRDRHERDKIRQESRQYHDIVQGDYDDSQDSTKALNGMLWLAMNCATVPFTIHATDRALLDVFLLERFLWEVLEAPERQEMLFGKLSLYQRSQEKQELEGSWSLSELGHMVPEVTEPAVSTHGQYLEDGAWFGRTQAIARLLTVSGVMPLVTPSSLYLTGLLARAAGLVLSPASFNQWWRSDHRAHPRDVGSVIGWTTTLTEPSRVELWELVVRHHTNDTRTRDALSDVSHLPSKTEFLRRKEQMAKRPSKPNNFITNHIPNRISQPNNEQRSSSEVIAQQQQHVMGHGSEMKRSVPTDIEIQPDVYHKYGTNLENATRKNFSKDQKYKKHEWPKNRR